MDQKQVQAEIETLLELIEQIQHLPEADEAMEANTAILLQSMDRLPQLLAIPSASCEGQTALATDEEVK